MRKKLLAFLAVLGLAGLSSPAQVVKGSQPADTKTADTTKNDKTGKTGVHRDAITVKQKTQVRRKTTHKKTASDHWQNGSTGSSKTGHKKTAADDWETGSSGTGHKKGSDSWMQSDSHKPSHKKTPKTATKTVQPGAAEKPVKQNSPPQ